MSDIVVSEREEVANIGESGVGSGSRCKLLFQSGSGSRRQSSCGLAPSALFRLPSQADAAIFIPKLFHFSLVLAHHYHNLSGAQAVGNLWGYCNVSPGFISFSVDAIFKRGVESTAASAGVTILPARSRNRPRRLPKKLRQRDA